MLPKEFKQDNDGIWYVDSNDIEIRRICFPKTGGFYNEDNPLFYAIGGVNNWIIKNTTRTPLLFNQMRVKKMIRKLSSKQEILSNIGLPIGYFKENNKVTGIIIPYYEKSISIYRVTSSYSTESIKKYYDHDDNDYNNVIMMELDILNILKKMFDNKISYLDIHSGNFLLYKNEVKIIDFEPGFIAYNNFAFNRDKIIRDYNKLIKNIFYRLNMHDYIDYYGNDFNEIEDNMKKLEKRIKR